MTTKIERINSAYDQLRISGLTIKPSPEDITIALGRLENMMSELEFGRNIRMNYNFEEFPDTGSLTNVAQPFWHMMDTNLAVRLIPDFNKQVPPTLLAQASQALATASAMSAADNIREIQNPGRMPIGSGTSLRYNKYQRFNREQRLPVNDVATNIMFIGDINDYRESFEAYMNELETIDSFTIESDKGLDVVSSTNNDPFIDYRIEALENQVTSGAWQQVKIIITTSGGRKNTRLISFELKPNLTVNNN